jgi:hypothetical protein
MYGCGLQDLFNSKTTDGLSGRSIGEVVKGFSCNLQSWARTHAVLVIGLYELLDPTT